MTETVVGEKGMVVAPHHAAAEIGAEVLRAGGNALEAMIAAAAAIAVVYPHMNGIGGDGFWLVTEPGRPVRAIDACGAAGSLATRAHYEKAGHHSVPTRGVDAALTVAGTVSGWQLALEIAQAMGGRLPREELLAPAVARAKAGITVSRSQAQMAAEHLADLAPVPGFADQFLADGKAPEEGATLKLTKLADTLDHLAHSGFMDFYRGDIAAEIAADFEAVEGVVTRDDLRRQEARLIAPLTMPIKGARLFNFPPPTQGLASLVILGLFDRLAVTRGESFAHIHGLIEATKRALQLRDGVVTDPAYGEDVTTYLDAAWLDAEADRIDRTHAAPWQAGGRPSDTIWMGAIDAKGRTVSFIQSLYWEFGSGLVLPRTGIIWQNRGSSFSLDPASLNPLEPGRKPFHTLNPPLALFDDGRMMTYGSMGGDGQPQFQAQIFTRHVQFGMAPDEAIAAPRFRVGRTWGRQEAALVLENRFDPDIVTALERAGHELTVSSEGYLDGMGHAGMIVRRADGRLLGASDPRCDGAAVAA